MKIYYTLIFFFLCSPVFSQTDLKNGLVACYPFNANAKDESGNGNNGMVNGATLTTDRFGKANSAYNFNGSTYIEVSPTQFQNNIYSFSIWAYPDVIPPTNTYFYPFSVGGSGGDQSIDLSNSANGANGWTFGGYSVGGGRVPFCDQGFLPPPAKWYHIVGIRDNTTMKMYVDGVLVKTDNTGGLNPSYGSNTKVTIGCRSSLVQFFQGKVDDIHVYNRVLTADEVKALYDSNNTSPTISISANNAAPCGGDKITFTANGAITSAKYQWKVDGINAGTNSKTFDYTSAKKTGDYSVKITVEVTDDDPCFPQKPATADQTFTIKDCTPPSTTVNLKNGLVACYPFNANAKDESGNGNNGTVNGATLTTDRFGKANSAYNFNGSSLISVNPNPFKNQSYSYSTWVYLDDTPISENQYSLISFGWITSDQNLLLTTPSTNFARIANGFSAWGYNNGTPPISNNWTGTTPDKGKWYHVVSTRDNSSMKLYVNGLLIANNSTTTATNATTPIYSTNSYGTFGARQNSTVYSEFLKGSLDDIHIYNRALNAAEVKALYDGNSATPITITADNPTPCGGDKIVFTANGASATAKYQWKVDGVDAGTNSKTLTFNAKNITAQYQVKVSVEVTDEDVCFPQKPTTTEQTITVKNCVVTPPSTGVDLKNGLVACYPFNANAKDESGNNNNGTVNGATLTADRFGKANSAYKFDGNSYISVSPNQFKNQSYTYATWVYLDNLPPAGDNSTFVSVGGPGLGDQVLSVTTNYSAFASNGFNCGGYNSGNPVSSNNWTGIKPDLGRWYHVAVTRDNTIMRLYVDGVLIPNNSPTTGTNGTNPSYANPANMLIGSRMGGSGLIQYMQGSLDDIHLYNRPLNAAEVKALYDGNSPQTIAITADKSAPCGGDKITFTANGATNTSKYQWKVDGVNAGTNSKTFTYNSVNKSADYQVKISVEVTDEDVCFPQKPATVDKTINIKFCSTPTANAGNKIMIPTAFSPNADGVNDTWEIFGLAGNTEVVVEIYNRWGEIIFYSKGYSEPWNGTYKGSPVPEGTYAYVVRVDADKVFKGAFLVVR